MRRFTSLLICCLLVCSILAQAGPVTPAKPVPSKPSNTVIVAKSGGDATTIAAGVAKAVSGKVVVVYPGTYVGNVTLGAGIDLAAVGDVTITGNLVAHSSCVITGNITVSGTGQYLVRGRPPQNVIEVWAGDSVQAAVDAAVDKGATTSNLYYVTYGPGVETTCNRNKRTGGLLTTANASAAGVILVPLEQIERDSIIPGQGIDKPISYLPSSYDAPLFAIRIDDCPVSWRTADATALGGLSPLDYAAFKGVRVTLCAVPYLWTSSPTRYMSPNQLYTATAMRGAEIAAHTYDHENIPATVADFYLQSVGAKLAIENAVRNTAESGYVDAAVPAECGFMARGWIQSGVYTTAAANLSTPTRARNTFANLIRQNYEWSHAYSGYTSRSRRHLAAYHWQSSDIATVYGWPEPPKRSQIIMFHGFVGLDEDLYAAGQLITFAQWKALIDKLAEWRDAGTCYPVTLTEYYTALTQAPVYDAAGTKLKSRSNGIPYGDFTNVVAGDITTTSTAKFWSRSAGTDVVTIDATGGIDAGPAVKLEPGASITTSNMNIVPGRSYAISYMAKATEKVAGTNARLRITIKYKYENDAGNIVDTGTDAHNLSTLRIYSPGADYPDTAEWVAFTPPAWALSAMVTFQHADAAGNVWIDSIDMIPNPGE